MPAHRASTFAYCMTGVFQFGFVFAYAVFSSWLMIEMFEFIFGSASLVDVYLRSAGASLALPLAFIAVPIALKWLLIGRWKPEQFPAWGLKYYRFWLVKTVLALNP